MLSFIFKPWVVFFIASLLYFATCVFYREVSDKLVFIGLALFSLSYIMAIFTWRGKVKLDKLLNDNYWHVLAAFIVICSISEYAYFGIPLFGGVNYTEFGFPIIHHMVVSSWLLIFIRCDNRFFNVVLIVFALINPILFVNRDVFLLTCCCAMVLMIIKGRIKPKLFVVVIMALLSLFGLFGQWRSANALSIISLPIIDEFYDLNPIAMWPILYLTVSSFNMGYNIETSSTKLYDVLLNTFPEPYHLFLDVGWLGVVFFFSFVIFCLYSILYLQRYRQLSFLLPMYVYYFYQSLMGSFFAIKLFTTNSIFVFLIFFIYGFLVFLKRP